VFFDVLEVAQKFHKLVDKCVVGTIVNAIHSCRINITNEKIGTIVANVPLGYILTSEEIDEICELVREDHKNVTSLIDAMKDSEYFRNIVRDKLTRVI